MSLETFQQIFDDLIELGGLEQIILSGMGDPSLNDALPEMVRYAHRHGDWRYDHHESARC